MVNCIESFLKGTVNFRNKKHDFFVVLFPGAHLHKQSPEDLSAAWDWEPHKPGWLKLGGYWYKAPRLVA